MSKEVGFSGKVSKQKSGFLLKIPTPTIQSLSLEEQDLVKIQLRNMDGKKIETTRKVMSNYRVYIPKNVKKELGLDHGEMVDVFLSKD